MDQFACNNHARQISALPRETFPLEWFKFVSNSMNQLKSRQIRSGNFNKKTSPPPPFWAEKMPHGRKAEINTLLNFYPFRRGRQKKDIFI